MEDRSRDNINEIEERLKIILPSIDELQSMSDIVVINKRGELDLAVSEILNYQKIE